jgi:hypothetical protein
MGWDLDAQGYEELSVYTVSTWMNWTCLAVLGALNKKYIIPHPLPSPPHEVQELCNLHFIIVLVVKGFMPVEWNYDADESRPRVVSHIRTLRAD